MEVAGGRALKREDDEEEELALGAVNKDEALPAFATVEAAGRAAYNALVPTAGVVDAVVVGAAEAEAEGRGKLLRDGAPNVAGVIAAGPAELAA